MLERLDSPVGTLAVRVTGHVTDADISAVIGWMDSGLREGQTLHLFAEVHQLSGVDPSGLVHGWLNGAHLLTQLRRFGRVAIVSEQRWIRTMARLESAILPGISYRVFEPDHREAAFSWVCGTI